MAKEPIQKVSASELKMLFADKHTEQDLADAYAITHNEFRWVEDNEYDYEEGTPAHKAARAVTDEWGVLVDEYKAKIFEILIPKGISIPSSGQIEVLEPFMEKHGYANGNGWWIKIK